MNADLCIEKVLENWARRVNSGRVGPNGYPSQSWSEAAMTRKGGPDTGLRSALGKETRSLKPMDEAGDWGLDGHIEAGVVRIKAVHPIVWAAGVAYYLGQVPIGFRASHRQRRRRFGRDDTTGILQLRRETLRRGDEHTEASWKALLARRLTMTPRTLDIHLTRFHDCMALWVTTLKQAS